MPIVVMPEVLDGHGARDLAKSINSYQKDDVEIDCKDVRRFGVPGVQTVLAARQHWAAQGQSITLSNLPEECRRQIQLLGIDCAVLGVLSEGSK